MSGIFVSDKQTKLTVMLIGAAILTYSSLCLHTSLATAQQAQTPAQLFQDKCSACHNLPDPATNAMTAVGWQRTVDRMINQHGAGSSISAAQQKTIVAYLDTFAVKPQNGSSANQNATDVWQSEPIYSHVYSFTSDAIATGLNTLSGRHAYRAPNQTDPKQLILAAFGSSNGLFSETLPAIGANPGSGHDLQLEADFQAAPPAPGDATTAPVSFGLAFDITSPIDYVAASYDDAKHTFSVTKHVTGQSPIIESIPIQGGLKTVTTGWHHIKVIVAGGVIKVWLDYEKVSLTANVDHPNTGDVGLCTNSRAVARNLIVDVYPIAVANAGQLQ